jgi:hypothetical protein
MSAGGVKEVAGHPAQFPALLTQWCGNFDAPSKTRTQKRPEKAQIQTATQLLIEKVGTGIYMIVASGLAIFVVICLLLSMVQNPPAIGR